MTLDPEPPSCSGRGEGFSLMQFCGIFGQTLSAGEAAVVPQFRYEWLPQPKFN